MEMCQAKNREISDCESLVRKSLRDLARKPADEESFIRTLNMWRFANN